MFAADERLARLRLARTDGVGPVSFAQLLRRFGSAVAAEAALLSMRKPLADAGLPQAEMARADVVGARHVFHGEADYPPLLAELGDPPPVLLMAGDAALAGRPVVAMVGARNASAAGRGLAREMAEALGAAGWVVASGMARGVDAAAHAGALATGTIACVAGGVDVAYPPENAALQAEVAAQGLVMSELPPGTEPQARHFPRRNRLIAGVARGVVVIEAAPGSGSLITARIAAELGREVMAVPGSPLDPRAGGCNQLIREGATLVRDAADVLEALSTLSGEARVPFALAEPTTPLPLTTPDTARTTVLALLSPTPVPVDDLVRQSALPAAQVASVLLDLELEGAIVRHAGARVALG